MSYIMILQNYKANEQELETEFDSSYVPLMINLQKLDNENLINSILKLSYDTRVDYRPQDEKICNVISKWNIAENLNVNTCKGKQNFNCLCGKKHIMDLHLFFHENVEGRIIIGSSCIDKLKILMKLCTTHKDLLKKIEDIMEAYGFEARKKLFRRCWSCKEYKIRRDTEYKLYMNNFFCRGCLVVHNDTTYIKCKICRKKIPVEKVYYGNKKKTKFDCAWKLLCKHCWKQTKLCEKAE